MGQFQVDPQETNMSGQSYSTTSSAGGQSYNDFYSVTPEDTDGLEDHEGETVWNPEWSRWHAYYKNIPEFAAVINKLGTWVYGREIVITGSSLKKFKQIKGNGKDTPRGVLKNVWKSAMICGDGFAEEVKDKQGRITNVKPLNSGKMAIVYNQAGIIIRYEEFEFNGGKRVRKETWNPDEIFHLQYERIGDEIHGKPFAEKLEQLILMRNEAMEDQKVVFHRYVKPIQIIKVKSDDDADLNRVQASFDNAYKKTENIIIPEDVVNDVTRVAIPQFATLDPLNWLKYIIRQFVTAAGVPEVVMGWGAETTEASSKVIFLAFVVDIKDYQGYNEEQIEIQLGIKLKLPSPPDLEPDLQNDAAKDAGFQTKVKVGDANTDTK